MYSINIPEKAIIASKNKYTHAEMVLADLVSLELKKMGVKCKRAMIWHESFWSQFSKITRENMPDGSINFLLKFK